MLIPRHEKEWGMGMEQAYLIILKSATWSEKIVNQCNVQFKTA